VTLVQGGEATFLNSMAGRRRLSTAGPAMGTCRAPARHPARARGRRGGGAGAAGEDFAEGAVKEGEVDAHA